MTKTELFKFMTAHKLGVLGTVSSDGDPQSALVGIAVTPELEIIFDTLTSTRKYANLVVNPSASFVIGWEGEVTVQLEGRAFLPTGADLARYQHVYFVAYPDGPDRMTWPGMTYFVVQPKWIRYSDYDQRPPRIEEFSF